MDTFEAIYERRSIRDFEPGKKIPDSIVDRIIKSAWYSLPDSTGQFPWKLLVVRKDQETKEILAQSAKEVAMTMFGSSFEIFGPGHLWYLPKDTQLRVAEYTTTGELWKYPRDCDVVFVPVISKGGFVDGLGPHSPNPQLTYQFMGFPTQNMWLVGHKYGIGAGYNGMPLLDIRRRELVGEHLGIPASWEPAGAFSFGYARVPRYFGPTRPPLEGCTFYEYWGNPYMRKALTEAIKERMELPKTEIEEVIQNLNFVDSFDKGVVPDWIIERVMDAGMWGPIPENMKNWRFIVIKDKKSKEFLRELTSEWTRSPWSFNWAELQHSRVRGTEEEKLAELEKVYERGLGKWLTEADTIIMILSTFIAWFDNPEPGIAAGPQAMFSISTGCCIQNMIIAASALGLGINYEFTAVGDDRRRELLNEYFGIPSPTWYVLGFLGLGKPGKRTVLRRPSIESLLYEEYWGNPYSIKTTT
jgi:nitroreductase